MGYGELAAPHLAQAPHSADSTFVLSVVSREEEEVIVVYTDTCM